MQDHSPTTSTPQDRSVRATRANFAFEAVMADRLYSAQRNVFGWRNWWMARTYEHLWPLANAWSAVCTLASLPDRAGVRDVLTLLLDGLAAYHRDGPEALTGQGPVGFESTIVPPLGRGGDVYYDDNAWLGLALARHQEICHDDLSAALAERIFRFVVTGWSTDADWAAPGGIRWSANPSRASRNTCANGPAAALGALVHRLTGDEPALEWAVRIYRWTRAALLRDDALYADRIGPGGAVTWDLWSYNQGSMIGAGVLLAEVTGDAAYLADARATAAAALAHFGLDDLVANGPAFNAVYFRNLFLLPPASDAVSETAPGAPTRPATGAPDGPAVPGVAQARGDGVDGAAPMSAWALAVAYDDLIWDARDRRSGLFPGRGSPLNKMGPLIQIDALLAGAAPHP